LIKLCIDILIYIQQDATLHSLFFLEIALYVSGGTCICKAHNEVLRLYNLHEGRSFNIN